MFRFFRESLCRSRPDFLLIPENVWDIMRGGRARWKIENETFNTLKNQGYHLEHNYEHGEQNLSVVLALLRRAAGQSLPENPNRSTHSWESKRAPNYRRFS